MKSALVQVIHLSWDKSARGGQGARDRSAVPQAFPVDRFWGKDGRIHVEELEWRHVNAFAEPIERRQHDLPIQKGYEFGCVTVSAESEGLSVRFRWDGAHGGAPDREYLNSTEDVTLTPGQWARIAYNGRFSDTDNGHWWYEQTSVNVACFGSEPSGRVFVETKPVREMLLFADLW